MNGSAIKANSITVGIESQSAFARYIGIDYSGAETPNSSLRACASIRLIEFEPRGSVPTAQSAQILDAARRCGMAGGASRRRRADAGRHRPWLSFPLRYFEVHHLSPIGRRSSRLPTPLAH